MSMGSVRKRGKTWTWYLDIGPDPLTGRRQQTSKGGFKTKKAAQEDLNTAIAKRQRGELAKRSKRTVRDFLEDEWLPTVETTRRPSTAANYRTNVKVHVVPLIGDIRLQALTPVQLKRLLRQAPGRPPARRSAARAEERPQHPGHAAQGPEGRASLGPGHTQRR